VTALEKRKEYERSNLQAALVILSDPRLNYDEDSLAVIWARAVLRNQGHLELNIEGEQAA
jgi:hypothetical protein